GRIRPLERGGARPGRREAGREALPAATPSRWDPVAPPRPVNRPGGGRALVSPGRASGVTPPVLPFAATHRPSSRGGPEGNSEAPPWARAATRNGTGDSCRERRPSGCGAG